MTRSGGARPPRMAGRLRELGLLESAIGRAAEGEPSAVFVHGESGVGKTRLVREICDRAREGGFTVVWGRCLRFGAFESAFLPWVTSLEQWLDAAHPAVRQRVLGAVPGAASVLPSLGAAIHDSAVRAVTVADALVSQIVALGPTVLVMDDVQWADAASRDALMYVIGGFGRQPLLVLATYRDEELGTGDPMHGWLADVRRLPGVGDLRLGRLSPAETEEQLTLLLGGVPSPGLVRDVVARSGGNAYLTELLTEGLDARAESLPEGLPENLSDALLAAWHRLPHVARDVLQTLVVAGRPTRVEQLRAVCADRGVPSADVTGALSASITGGLVVRTDEDTVWFRHPLLAEVLEATFLPGEAAPLHRAWAAGLRSTSAVGGEDVRRLGDLARHFEGAGDLDESFAASLEAADAARGARLWRDEAMHLVRAARLWPRVDTTPAGGRGEAELWERAAVTLARVGRSAEAVAAADRGLALAEASGDVLLLTRLTLIRWDELFWTRGHGHDAVADARRLVSRTEALSDTAEHARALAELTWALVWVGDLEEARRVAEAALVAARRSASPAAMSVAHEACAWANSGGESECANGQEALRYARLAADPDLVSSAAQALTNCLLARGRLREAVQMEIEALQWALEDGALASAVWRSGFLAATLAEHGRLREGMDAVRTGLSVADVSSGSAVVRLAAMVIAVRRGDLPAAELHERRAQEQVVALEERPGLEAPPGLAEYLLARGEPARALHLVRRTLQAHSVDPRVADRMVMWGARAAADLVLAARDRGDHRGVDRARAELAQLVGARAGLPGEPFEPADADDSVQPAYAAIFAAEMARCSGVLDPDAWSSAARLCERASLHWEQNLARWRQAESLAIRGAAGSAAAPLREVRAYASREGAARLLVDVEALAASIRVPLEDPRQAPPEPRPPSGRLSGLTAREGEVLAHLVAGRTYAEIAEALFISEKTVSTHVSHLLRKTGTRSRQEVSALALRLRATDATGSGFGQA